MTNNNTIIFTRLPAQENQILYKFEYPDNVRNYFQTDSFQIQYEFPVTDLPEGILMIPAVAQVAPVAWIKNCDIKVKNLEGTFIKSYESIQRNINKLLPALRCRSEIYCENIDHYDLSGSHTGLMFTTGLDSFSALIRHQDQISDLLYLRGADVPLRYPQVLDTVINEGRSTAEKYDMNYHMAEIDTWGFFNWDNLNKEYHALLKKDWWELIQHGMSLLGTVIPICAHEGISTLLISSTFSTSMTELNGSHPLIDESLHWGENTQIHHVDFDLTRQAKIHQIIKPWGDFHGEFPMFRVCYHNWELYNCCKCEKCSQTICGLLVEGIDPRNSGFRNFDTSTLQYIRHNLINGNFAHNKAELYFWKDIQSHIDHAPAGQVEGISDFLKWFRGYRLHTPPSRWIRSITHRVHRVLQHWDEGHS